MRVLKGMSALKSAAARREHHAACADFTYKK
jgi:hypothetical protein